MNSRLKNFFIKDPIRKCLALALALLFYVQLNKQIGHNRNIETYHAPVKLILGDGLKEIFPEHQRIALKLHVPRNYEIHPQTVEILVQVGNKNYNKATDRYQVEISRKNVKIDDSQIRFAGFKDGENPVLSLKLTRSIVRDIPVKLRFSGNAPSGAVPKGKCLPEKVQITGPENIVNELQYVSTTQIPLEEASGDFECEEIGLQLPAGVSAVPAKINAKIALEKNSVRQIFGLPLCILSAPEDGRAEVITPLKNGVTVSLKGPGEILSRLPHSKIKVFADAAGLRISARRRVKLHCFIDEPGVTVMELLPGEIELKMTK